MNQLHAVLALNALNCWCCSADWAGPMAEARFAFGRLQVVGSYGEFPHPRRIASWRGTRWRWMRGHLRTLVLVADSHKTEQRMIRVSINATSVNTWWVMPVMNKRGN